MRVYLQRSFLLCRRFSKLARENKLLGPVDRVIMYRHPAATREESASSIPTYLVKLCSYASLQVVDFKIPATSDIQALLTQVQQIGSIQNATLWKGSVYLSPKSPISSILGSSVFLKGNINGTETSIALNGGLPVEAGNFTVYNLKSYISIFTFVGGMLLLGVILKLQSKTVGRSVDNNIFDSMLATWKDPNLSFWEKFAVPVYTPEKHPPKAVD